MNYTEAEGRKRLEKSPLRFFEPLFIVQNDFSRNETPFGDKINSAAREAELSRPSNLQLILEASLEKSKTTGDSLEL